MNKKLIVVAVAALCGGQALAAEDMPVLTVEAEALGPNTVSVDLEEVDGNYADGGDFLRSLSGVEGSRMGGHGIDPVIRGQGQNRVNVLLDGAYLYGGCPNRMDPPSSYAPIETFDTVTVIKGGQSVIYGGGGSGGTVLFERETQPLAEGEGVRATVGGGYASNGNVRDLFADATTGSTTTYVRGIVMNKQADNYEDGDGNEVRSSYAEQSGNLIVGYRPDANTRMELGIEAFRGEDVMFVGMMDSPVSDTDNLRLSYEREGLSGPFSAVKAELYQADVYHLMDNYSLDGRPVPAMYMETEVDSVTRGGRFSGDIGSGTGKWTVGIDYQNSRRDAVLSSGMMPTSLVEAGYLWPDAEIAQTGLFAESSRDLSEGSRVKYGLRYDRVTAEAHKADDEPAAMGIQMPNELYLAEYGVTAEKREENNLGGFVRYEQDLAGGNGLWYAAASRNVRTADANERFMAMLNMMNPMMSWYGNPDINPEVHQQLELGLNAAHNNSEINLAVYVDNVSDYITSQRSMSGTHYYNVDAVLYGMELDGNVNMAGPWSVSYSVATTYGQNTTDDKPLAQIPPISGTLGVDYQRDDWGAGLNIRGVDGQSRTDTLGGDVSDVSPGYSVVDLYGSYAISDDALLRFGVDNLMDRTYADHLNDQDIFGATGEALNEPGRNYWMRASVNF